MVLNGLWPSRGKDGALRLRRRYNFEFTSTGTERYLGMIELIGQQFSNLELAPHIYPED